MLEVSEPKDPVKDERKARRIKQRWRPIWPSEPAPFEKVSRYRFIKTSVVV
jgi:hypothetical protein